MAQNLPKNSERTKNKKNTQKLWIRKSLTEQMCFQMSLKLQEISDVTKAAWKWVPNSWAAKWNEPSPADLRLTLTLLYITKPHKNHLQNTQHVVLRNRPTLPIGTERLACPNNPRGVQLGTLA